MAYVLLKHTVELPHAIGSLLTLGTAVTDHFERSVGRIVATLKVTELGRLIRKREF